MDKKKKNISSFILWPGLKSRLIFFFFRLSYYDRSYPKKGDNENEQQESTLSMTWPKQPLRIWCAVSSADAAYVLDRLRELFACRKLKWSESDLGRQDVSYPVKVVWDNQVVDSRIRVFQCEATNSQMGLADCHLICKIGGNDEDVEPLLNLYLPKEKGQRIVRYQKDYFNTPNMLLSKKVALIRSCEALSINQIYHLVRGDIPEYEKEKNAGAFVD